MCKKECCNITSMAEDGALETSFVNYFKCCGVRAAGFHYPGMKVSGVYDRPPIHLLL
jgi:hypothetical protein